MPRDELRIEITKEAKESATNCAKDFACLRSTALLCKVEKFVGEEVLFVECLQQGYCSYQRRFGFTGYMCTCPVRKEIYSKYNL